MTKIRLLLFCSPGLLMGSCAVLTKSQVENVHVFATSANEYTYFPGEIITKRAELVLEERLVGATQLSADHIKTTIDKAQKNFLIQQEFAEKFDLSLELIRQYAGLLSQLSSSAPVESLTGDTAGLNTNLGNLVGLANEKFNNKIPSAVGNAITDAIFAAGQRLTMYKQARALKKFIPQGDTLIAITAKNLVEVLGGDMPQLLKGDREEFINTYTNTILLKPEKVDYSSLKQYLLALNKYDNLELLRTKCISAATDLADAHRGLAAMVKEKKNLKEILKETRYLALSVRSLYTTFKNLTAVSPS